MVVVVSAAVVVVGGGGGGVVKECTMLTTILNANKNAFLQYNLTRDLMLFYHSYIFKA